MKSLLGKLGVILIGVAIFGFLIVPVANAQVSLKNYKKMKDTDAFKIYIDGVGTGFLWANTELEHIGQSPLYCPPDKLALTRQNYLQILQDYIEKEEENVKRFKERARDDWPVEMFLLQGLKETFPCKK